MGIMATPSSLITSTQTVQLSKSQRELLFASRRKQRLWVRAGGAMLLGLGLSIWWLLIPGWSTLQTEAMGPLELLPPVFATGFFGLYGLYLMARGKPSNGALATVLLLSGVLAASVYFHARMAHEQAQPSNAPASPLRAR